MLNTSIYWICGAPIGLHPQLDELGGGTLHINDTLTHIICRNHAHYPYPLTKMDCDSNQEVFGIRSMCMFPSLLLPRLTGTRLPPDR